MLKHVILTDYKTVCKSSIRQAFEVFKAHGQTPKKCSIIRCKYVGAGAVISDAEGQTLGTLAQLSSRPGLCLVMRIELHGCELPRHFKFDESITW